MKTLIKKATLKKMVSLAIGAAMLMGTQAFAIEQVNDSEYYLGTDGWIDSMENVTTYSDGETISGGVFSNSGNRQLKNRIVSATDPKGQNGKCFALNFGKFDSDNAASTAFMNPYLGLSGSTIEIGGGAAMFSFDMYLPTNFYSSGTDETKLLVQVYPHYTGTSKSSDYQTWYFTKDGLSVPGFDIAALPVGRWFNVKYILNCDPSSENIGKVDLYIDGKEIGKNVTSKFSLNAGVGYDNIANNGISNIRLGLITTNSDTLISPEYRVYLDNFELRALKDVEVLSYSYKNGQEGTDTLATGTNTFDVKIRNRGAENVTPVVGIMLYRDGELCGLSVDNATEIAAGADADVSLSVNVDTLDDGEYELRTFVWDGAETLNSVKTQMTLKE